jgi:hypothetical protein
LQRKRKMQEEAAAAAAAAAAAEEESRAEEERVRACVTSLRIVSACMLVKIDRGSVSWP